MSWAQFSGSPQTGHVRQYRDGQWSEDATPTLDEAGSYLNLGISDDGIVSLLQNVGGATWAYRTDAAGTWATPPDNLGATGDATSDTSIAFDEAGNGLAVWAAATNDVQQRIHAMRYAKASGKWAPATVVPGSQATESGPDYYRTSRALAMDPEGNAVALWFAVDTAGSDAKLMSSHFEPASGWATAVPIGGTWSEVPRYGSPALVFDGKTFVAAFTAQPGNKLQALLTRFDSAAQERTPPEVRQAQQDPNSAEHMPKLATDGRGHLILVYASYASGDSPKIKLHYQRYANDAWSATKVVTPTLTTSFFFWSLSSNADGLAAASTGRRRRSGVFHEQDPAGELLLKVRAASDTGAATPPELGRILRRQHRPSPRPDRSRPIQMP